MTDRDRSRWDEKYTGRGPASVCPGDPPAVFARYWDVFPTSGQALDLACGQARDLARRSGVDAIAAGEGAGETWLVARARPV